MGWFKVMTYMTLELTIGLMWPAAVECVGLGVSEMRNKWANILQTTTWKGEVLTRVKVMWCI